VFPIEAFRRTLDKVIAVLFKHGIRFHLTGGVTTVLYGEPRITQGIDVVVHNEAIAARLEEVLYEFSRTDFLFDPQTIRRAVANRGRFQLYDSVESLKLDLYAREMIEGELGRSQIMEVFDGVHLPVSSRIDAAVSKLIWVDKGSHKSRRDFRSIFKGSSGAEQQEILRMIDRIGLHQLAEAVLREPDEIE
jgi:hypothetical protein